MNTYLLNLWDWARTSYWFIPGLIAVAAVLLAFAVPWIDGRLFDAEIEPPKWLQTTTGTARTTLSALAGAMMTVTGTVFSITIVTLSLTSQQFGPRLLRRFMFDLPTQVTLGVFLATGLYCLLLLRIVENRAGADFALHYSVFAAVLLAVVSMAFLIFFIHHVAMLIQAPQVVAGVARDLDDAIVRLFPEQIREEREQSNQKAPEQPGPLGEPDFVVNSKHEGYVQAIDLEGLVRLASRHDLLIELTCRPGDFITIDTVLAEGHGHGQGEDKLEEDALNSAVNETVIVGVRRTPRQDVLCAIEELVEVAVRSLSPGINDPFTAINCVDRLGAAIGRLSQRQMAKAFVTDSDDKIRVIGRPVEFKEILAYTFDPIRENCEGNSMVAARIQLALESIHSRATREDDLRAIEASMKLHRFPDSHE